MIEVSVLSVYEVKLDFTAEIANWLTLAVWTNELLLHWKVMFEKNDQPLDTQQIHPLISY